MTNSAQMMRELMNIVDERNDDIDITDDIPDDVNEEAAVYLSECFSSVKQPTKNIVREATAHLYNHLEENELLADMDFDDVYEISNKWFEASCKKRRPVAKIAEHEDEFDESEMYEDGLEPVEVEDSVSAKLYTEEEIEENEKFWDEMEKSQEW